MNDIFLAGFVGDTAGRFSVDRMIPVPFSLLDVHAFSINFYSKQSQFLTMMIFSFFFLVIAGAAQ
jgi:hypothetical protein